MIEHQDRGVGNEAGPCQPAARHAHFGKEPVLLMGEILSRTESLGKAATAPWRRNSPAATPASDLRVWFEGDHRTRPAPVRYDAEAYPACHPKPSAVSLQ